jgi:hypothetical protein
MIYIESKRKKINTLIKKYPNALIIDVTSKSLDDLKKLSPFYPHGDIPIPFSNERTALCVEGIWQGLKVFETADVDEGMFVNGTMRDIKRTVRRFGKPLGHRKGINGIELLNYLDARIQIFLPSYNWVLMNKVSPIIEKLKKASESRDFVLLDYATNCDILDLKKPLSHAYLVKVFVEGNYPTEKALYKELEDRKSNPRHAEKENNNAKVNKISRNSDKKKRKNKQEIDNPQLGLF